MSLPGGLGLFVIWPTAREHEDRILDDLDAHFRVLRVVEIEWTPSLVMENYRRFYSDLPLRGVYHQFNKGAGPFTAVVLSDPEPNVTVRPTSRGERTVNANFTDAKNRYRVLTQGLNVHCGETEWENVRDMTMLLGPAYTDSLEDSVAGRSPDREVLRQDVTGAHGWDTPGTLFVTLERSVPYVCLSGYEDGTLHHEGWHFATRDPVAMHAILNPMSPLYRARRPAWYSVRIGSVWQPVYVDFGDHIAGTLSDVHRDTHGVLRHGSTEVALPATPGREPMRLNVITRVVDIWLRLRDSILLRARWLQSVKHAPGLVSARLRTMHSHPALRRLLRRSGLFIRGIVFSGRRFRCPVCGWSVRGFMARHGWSVDNEDGYCPRCNAKARHRRIWLHLENQSQLFRKRHRVLEIGPAPVFADRLAREPTVDYIGVDTDTRVPGVAIAADGRNLPFADASFDAVLCHHVLEHVDDDRALIAEMARVLHPSGWSLVSVPLDTKGRTVEDPSITDPAERTRLFGEPGHVRAYGMDIIDRFDEAGFNVELHDAELLDDVTLRRHGLKRDEHLLVCHRRV